MDELCKNKPWVDPLAVAGLSVETKTSADKENEKENTSKLFYLKFIMF